MSNESTELDEPPTKPGFYYYKPSPSSGWRPVEVYHRLPSTKILIVSKGLRGRGPLDESLLKDCPGRWSTCPKPVEPLPMLLRFRFTDPKHGNGMGVYVESDSFPYKIFYAGEAYPEWQGLTKRSLETEKIKITEWIDGEPECP